LDSLPEVSLGAEEIANINASVEQFIKDKVEWLNHITQIGIVSLL
jgi:hypothetical protein